VAVTQFQDPPWMCGMNANPLLPVRLVNTQVIRWRSRLLVNAGLPSIGWVVLRSFGVAVVGVQIGG